jgi:hypothetical protein
MVGMRDVATVAGTAGGAFHESRHGGIHAPGGPVWLGSGHSIRLIRGFSVLTGVTRSDFGDPRLFFLGTYCRGNYPEKPGESSHSCRGNSC